MQAVKPERSKDRHEEEPKFALATLQVNSSDSLGTSISPATYLTVTAPGGIEFDEPETFGHELPKVLCPEQHHSRVPERGVGGG